MTTKHTAARLLTIRRLEAFQVSSAAPVQVLIWVLDAMLTRPVIRRAVIRREVWREMLKREELLKMFESAGAVRHGHFELSSGLHSGSYVQCAQVLQYPRLAEKLGQELAALFSDATIEAVVSPAMGGLIIGQEVARALPQQKSGLPGAGVPAMFVERDASGTMCLRRGFTLKSDQHVLVIEDVWTTGGSTQEAIQVVEEAGGRVVAAGALIDRSGGRIEFPVESQALLDLPIASYEPDDCPLCRDGSAAVKPGSRFVRSA